MWSMRFPIRLLLSTGGYARAFTITFLCFILVGFIRQQKLFIRSIHDRAQSSLPFLVVDDDLEHRAAISPIETSTSKTGLSSLYPKPYTKTSLQSCRVRNETFSLPETPSFIIIGAQKAGSSALADNLKRHPNIVGSKLKQAKELHFLDWFIPKKEKRDEKQRKMNITEEELWCYYRNQYAQNFDINLLTRNSSMLAFDKTPSYMFHSYSLPQVLHHVCPWTPKLIAILRNPIDRAWSHFNMAVVTDRTNKLMDVTFEDALNKELKSLRRYKLSTAPELDAEEWNLEGFQIPLLSSTDVDAAHKKHFREIFLDNYLQRGMYAIQLRRWKEVFGANLLVVTYDQLYGPDSQLVYDQILDHVGVPRAPLPVMKEKHWSRQFYRHTMSNRTRTYLQLFFQPYNEMLAPLLMPHEADGKDYFTWS